MVLFLFVFAVAPVLAQQLTLGRVVGSVVDPSGAVVPGASVELSDERTGRKVTTTSGTDGRFTFLDVINGNYTVTVSVQGFNQAVYSNIVVETGRTAEVTARLAVGGVETQVVVEAATEVLETQTARVENTVSGHTLRNLPLTNRDALDFVLNMPGISQGGTIRQSTFYGLGKGALSITMDGVNIQDQINKSAFGGGMFTMIRPRLDAVEEVTVTGAALGADQNAEGAVHIKFATRRAGNDWRGAAFWYYRDQGLNANSFFNNRQGIPRGRNHLNQMGLNLGGPLIKDKLFIFSNFEDFRQPSSLVRNRSIASANAQAGIFNYTADCVSSACPAGVVHGQAMSVNVLGIAAASPDAGPFLPSTVDPSVQAHFDRMNAARGLGGISLGTGAGPVADVLTWDAPSTGYRRFHVVRTDWHATERLRFNFIGHYNHFASSPDTLNTMDPVLPGETVGGGQNGNRWQVSMGGNYTITPNMSYSFNVGKQSATTFFFAESRPDLLAPEGFRMNFGGLFPSLHGRPTAGAATNFTFLPSSRNFPILNSTHTLGWVKGKHTMSFGLTTTHIASWARNSGGIPTLNFGMPATDFATASFARGTAANPGSLPGISATDQATARQLYAILTGRISSISNFAWVDAATSNYVLGQDLLERNKQNEFGFFGQDSWRVFRTLTLSYGLRYQWAGSAHEIDGLYTSPTWEDLWGKSGVGNLFMPGTLTGTQNPQLHQRSRIYNSKGNFAPSFGLSWSPDVQNSAWNAIFGGSGKSVFRAGYSLAYNREGIGHHLQYASGNPGLSQSISGTQSINFDHSCATPPCSGALPGQPLARNPLPALSANPASFTFPVAMSDFTFVGGSWFSMDPDIRTPYVQSWNVGIQRELNRRTVLEARYVGNRGTRLWRGSGLNEVNIFESGFLDAFNAAKSNLDISVANGMGNNFNNQGLPGQVSIPFFDAAFAGLSNANGFTNTTFVTNLNTGSAGGFANTLANTAAYKCRLVGSNLDRCAQLGFVAPGPFPANILLVNPDAAGRTPWALHNGSFSTYNGATIELRRRMADGFMVNAHYTFSKALTDLYGDQGSSSIGKSTLRKENDWVNKNASAFDFQHSFRTYFIYELPFGEGKRWANQGALSKAIGGWQVLGVVPIQSGRRVRLTGGRASVNQFDSGVVLVGGTTTNQLHGLEGVDKSHPVPCSAAGRVFWLSTSTINPANCQANPDMLAQPTTPGVWHDQVFLRGPRFVKPDLTLAKNTRITERITTSFRAEFFNAFNYSNFMVGTSTAAGVSQGITSSSFGQTNTFFQDTGNQDLGPRMVQFVFRVEW